MILKPPCLEAIGGSRGLVGDAGAGADAEELVDGLAVLDQATILSSVTGSPSPLCSGDSLKATPVRKPVETSAQ